MTDAAVRDAYLERLGLAAEPPSLDALGRIHRAHVERVPWETLWIHLGERHDIEVAASTPRLASRARGGYCFHLNGALGELLSTLGYDVVRHVGGVHGPDGAGEHEMTNHLVLTVHGLPGEQNPEGVWYVDVGLGDAVYEPIPLVPGTYEQPPFRLTIERSPSGVGDWHLVHDPAGSFAGMEWRAAPATMDAFAERHTWFATSPDSWFAKLLIVQRRDATGADILRGCSLRRVGADAYESTITTSGELFDVLAEVFALDLDDVDDNARAVLWDRVRATDEAWNAAEPSSE